MEREIKRYRIRPKPYLCVSPEEALSTGISTGEQIVEEIDLVLNPGIGYFMYAAIRNLDETQIRKIPVSERGEKIFESRREAVKYIRENSGFDGAVVVEKVREADNPNFGFNAEKDEYEDLVKAGIIDPTKEAPQLSCLQVV